MSAIGTLTWPEIPVPEITIPGTGPDSVIHDVPGEPVHWAILLPLLAALLTVLVVRRSSRAAAWVNVSLGFLTVLVAVYLAYLVGHDPGPHSVGTIGELPLGDLSVPVELSTHRLASLVSVLVALIGFGGQVFARWYLWFDPRYRSFAATLSLLTAAMLLLVHSDDIVLTLAGWLLIGWCTFLLIGHTSTRDVVNRAAGKSLIVTRVADGVLILGLVMVAAPAGTTSISGLQNYWTALDSGVGSSMAAGADRGMLTAGLICVVIGVLGRTAQFPFHDWLPDAVHAPTPATAVLQSVTLIGAGAVLLSGLVDLLALVPAARLVLAIAVAISIIGAAILAFAQPDLKRLLAWSTISQGGVILAALILAAQSATGPDAALAHLTSHTIGKALLFLTVGWLAVLTGGTAVMHLVGTARLYRSVRAPLALGLLTLAGVPPTLGFLSVLLNLSHAESTAGQTQEAAAVIVLAAMGAAVPLTAAYCMRAWLILDHRRDSHSTPGEQLDDFFIESGVEAEAVAVEEAESAISSSARLVVISLALASVLGGVLLFTPVLRTDVLVSLELLIAAPAIMVAAALAVWVSSRGVRSRDAAARIPARAALASERGWGMSTLYSVAVARPVLRLAHGVNWLDHEVIDGYLRGAGHATRLAGDLGERLEHSAGQSAGSGPGTGTGAAEPDAADPAGTDPDAADPAATTSDSDELSHGQVLGVRIVVAVAIVLLLLGVVLL